MRAVWCHKITLKIILGMRIDYTDQESHINNLK